MNPIFLEQGVTIYHDKLSEEKKRITMYSLLLNLGEKYFLLMSSHEPYQSNPSGITSENLEDAKRIIDSSSSGTVIRNLSSELYTSFGVFENGNLVMALGEGLEVAKLLSNGRWGEKIHVDSSKLNPLKFAEITIKDKKLTFNEFN